MKLKNSRLTMILIGFLLTIYRNTKAWELDEHQQLADSSFSFVLRECGLFVNDDRMIFDHPDGFTLLCDSVHQGMSFGQTAAFFSQPDLDPRRFHVRGKTVLEQLKNLPESTVIEIFRAYDHWSLKEIKLLSNAEQNRQRIKLPEQNVLMNYLIYHLLALRYVSAVSSSSSLKKEVLRIALVYEAIAQTYLADSFSSGHMLVPLSDRVARLHPFNNLEGHNFYNHQGLYVINSSGEVWQTFGDKMLRWYAPSYRHVLKACVFSLRELFLVYFISMPKMALPPPLLQWALSISDGQPLEQMIKKWLIPHNGSHYYAVTRMPTLLLIPIPVSASWSVRSDTRYQYEFNTRTHYPQFKEISLHDPEIDGIKNLVLYSADSFPNWMLPDLLKKESVDNLIKFHPDIASVRYVQQLNLAPSYRGLLFSFGSGLTKTKDHLPFQCGLAYGYSKETSLLKSFSIESGLVMFLGNTREVLGAQVSIRSPLPKPILFCTNMRLETGYLWNLVPGKKQAVGMYSLSLESKTIPLGFTYAGIKFRVGGRLLKEESIGTGLFFQIVFL